MSPDEPRRPRRAPLTRRERWLVAAWALAPIGLVMVALSPFVVTGRATFAELVGAAIVYGGLLSLAAGFVAYDRVQARQCPRCTTRNPRKRPRCSTCDYDLVLRPRYQCDQGHAVRLDPGLCDCGRRLQRREPPRGLGRQVVAMLRAGAWMLGFLLAVGLVLQWLGG